MQQLPKPLITPFCFLSNAQLGLLTVSHVELCVPLIQPGLAALQSLIIPSSHMLRAANRASCSRGTQGKVQAAQSERLKGASLIYHLGKCRRCFPGLA